jgi:transposase
MGEDVNIAVGVDAHKASFAVVAISSLGEELVSFSVPATPEGFCKAYDRVGKLGGDVSWGIEGTYTYGLGLAEFLVKKGVPVYEVPGSVTKRYRRQGTRRGKSDPIDARAIAQAVLLEQGRLSRYDRSEDHEAVRLLYDSRDRLVRHRTEAINRVRAFAHILGVLNVPTDLTRSVGLKRLRASLDALREHASIVDALRLDEVEDGLVEIERLNIRVRAIEDTIRPFVERLASKLLEMYGVSIVVAAGLIGHAGSLRNCRDSDAFAMRAGVAPVPCSSGKSSAVRLNRGGNRQLNRLLHNIALTQLRSQEQLGRIYYDRKRVEGKSHRAAMRALKRQLATVVFYRLRASQPAMATDLHAA